MKLDGFTPDGAGIVIHSAFAPPMRTPQSVALRHSSALLYVVRGGIRFNIKGKEMIARERDIVYLPEGCSYSYKASREISALSVEFDIIGKSGKKSVFSPFPVLACSDTPEKTAEHFSLILKSFAINSLSAKIERICSLLSLLAFINDSDKEEQEESIIKRLAPAVYRLREGYCEKVYTAELAALCGLSESQFRRLFKEAFKVSPITYKNNLRIKMACSLLESGAYSISEISDILGFDDIYAFSHAFKKSMGTAPSEY
ncbi:MAG: helix-turn-helix transcriptional regulator [Clostridia bacterium]|nr:helix-turn-helix transcriptional regulator [Clostridia bacterium]